MPNVFDKKEASAFSNEWDWKRVIYDFDKDGGAVDGHNTRADLTGDRQTLSLTVMQLPSVYV